MPGLSATRLLETVDEGAALDAAGRADVMFAAALPTSPQERATFSLGDRDAWLLELRCATFGDLLPARVACPKCSLLVGVEIGHEHLSRRPPVEAPAPPAPARLSVDGYELEVTPPDGSALARAAACPDVVTARASLVDDCLVVIVSDVEDPVDPNSLPESVVERAGAEILVADPQSEVTVGLICAGCGHDWAPVLDIALFTWSELEVAAAQILDEVHDLAHSYGWSEPEILALSSRRRRRYVERLAGG